MRRLTDAILAGLILLAGVALSTTPLGPSAIAQAPVPTPAPAPIPAPEPTPAPKPEPEPAKAVITLFDGSPVPDRWRQGFSVPLSAARSNAGDKPQSLRWFIEPPEYNTYSVRRDNGRSIDVQTGIEPVTLRVRLAVARGDTFDETMVEIKVGDRPRPPPTPDPDPEPVDPIPTPTPTPTPTPQPGPAPTDKFGKLGRDFGTSLLSSYGDTMEESAAMLAAGITRKAVIADFDKRWKARRDKSSDVPASEFAKITPDDREPQGDEKARLVQAWRDFARGVKGR